MIIYSNHTQPSINARDPRPGSTQAFSVINRYVSRRKQGTLRWESTRQVARKQYLRRYALQHLNLPHWLLEVWKAGKRCWRATLAARGKILAPRGANLS